MIKITIEDRNGKQATLGIPSDVSLSLMEVLKAADYEILAACGGMGLCATCQVQVVKGFEKLPPRNDQELDMMDILPNADQHSRLSCQLRINEEMDGMIFRIIGGD
ncbi:2Fe-2S iron-sulfur cluster-binding protein [Mucilaginibacter flavidus]|uniref:2Fe-2S iron-sulfur cluster-binding protein n=1 Tax=Mucilaginibacter flavidus TaxID=2949309 RepID=UPI002093096E|nr:2Fe-2S iron-sulfur cluster-binding protein [Mucilaginibacter flavidus]MCO5948588.1 (2Fe-2S)-binding protein [Mucilaginibacter flavidus]